MLCLHAGALGEKLLDSGSMAIRGGIAQWHPTTRSFDTERLVPKGIGGPAGAGLLSPYPMP